MDERLKIDIRRIPGPERQYYEKCGSCARWYDTRDLDLALHHHQVDCLTGGPVRHHPMAEGRLLSNKEITRSHRKLERVIEAFNRSLPWLRMKAACLRPHMSSRTPLPLSFPMKGAECKAWYDKAKGGFVKIDYEQMDGQCYGLFPGNQKVWR